MDASGAALGVVTGRIPGWLRGRKKLSTGCASTRGVSTSFGFGFGFGPAQRFPASAFNQATKADASGRLSAVFDTMAK
jgi:hypothetical protein